MKIVILCGGAGVRFDHILPKPLNLIHGRPMIYYTIESLQETTPLTELHIFYFKGLEEYGIRQHLVNQFKSIQFFFYPIPYQTRGPVESMLLGLKQFPYENESILFLDNDNIYKGFDISTLPVDKNILLYTDNKTSLQHYCFLQVEHSEHGYNIVTDIKERVPISSYIGAGGYGFRNKEECIKYGTMVINESISVEPYMSYVFQRMIDNKQEIVSYYLPDQFSIGTPSEILKNEHQLPKHRLTVIFDLDNTIVTYPTEYKDYRTVQPYPSIITLMKQLKEEGHKIIIHTARKMVSCNGNVDEIRKQVEQITIDSLAKYEVPYDEIIFGKPYGDLYIDDKAFNPFDMSLRNQIGFFNYNHYHQEPIHQNRYHRFVRTSKNTIIKMGTGLEGEHYFYQTINQHSNPFLQHLFPSLQQSISPNCLALEYIRGTPLNQIYSEGLLQPGLFLQFLRVIKEFHKVEIDDKVCLTHEDMKHHYIDKFEERSLRKQDFPFPNHTEIYSKIKEFIVGWVSDEHPINSIIHGDCWFSNIMYSSKNFYLIDMRGKVYNKLTIKGHCIYDWAKLYQSIVGLDHIIHYGEAIPTDIREPIESIFWKECPYEIQELSKMTAYLLYNTFHSYPPDFELEKKQRIWESVEKLINFSYKE